MNPRKNLQTRKNRRKRNERWEYRGRIGEWLFREECQNMCRFMRTHFAEIAGQAGDDSSRALLSGEISVIHGFTLNGDLW